LATQTDFLAALGIGDALQRAPAPSEIEAFYALRRGAMELIDPSGLGRIRVLVQGRGVPHEIPRGLAGDPG
jgi:SAM-dependent MidA family methyltransferase